jgi:predicted lipoprotein
VRRRALLKAAVSALPVAALGTAACRRKVTREETLAAIVREVVVPSTRNVAATSERLVRVTQALANEPGVKALGAARAAFRPALLAWKGAQCFRQGPLVETNALLRALFWPARPDTIEKVLAFAQPADDSVVANLGVDAKGLYALEYLLFPLELDETAAAERFSSASGVARRALAAALARNVHSYAKLSLQRLGSGEAYAERFSKGGGESLSALLAELIGSVENACTQRLDYVLKLADSRLLKPREIEGWPSGLSHEIALQQISSTEHLYRGGRNGGISDLTQAVAPAIDQRVRERYAEAISAVKVLGAPLERVVHSNRAALSRAAAATKKLEITLKVDLASALGVTLTFASTDGD